MIKFLQDLTSTNFCLLDKVFNNKYCFKKNLSIYCKIHNANHTALWSPKKIYSNIKQAQQASDQLFTLRYDRKGAKITFSIKFLTLMNVLELNNNKQQNGIYSSDTESEQKLSQTNEQKLTNCKEILLISNNVKKISKQLSNELKQRMYDDNHGSSSTSSSSNTNSITEEETKYIQYKRWMYLYKKGIVQSKPQSFQKIETFEEYIDVPRILSISNREDKVIYFESKRNEYVQMYGNEICQMDFSKFNQIDQWFQQNLDLNTPGINQEEGRIM